MVFSRWFLSHAAAFKNVYFGAGWLRRAQSIKPEVPTLCRQGITSGSLTSSSLIDFTICATLENTLS